MIDTSKRSPKLRPDRPFKVRHCYWFGDNALNGYVWKIQTRMRQSVVNELGTTQSSQYYTHSIRDGGPFCDYTPLAEALRWVRDYRRQLSVAAWALARMRAGEKVL